MVRHGETDYNKKRLFQGRLQIRLNEKGRTQAVQLAKSLRPVVLPGEKLTVRLLKEGREPQQAVAYLDDGTMVVVDNARKMIGKTIDISVTSVLQTTAGKMIFGKWDERMTGRHDAKAVSSPLTSSPPAVPVPSVPGTSGTPADPAKKSPSAAIDRSAD